MEPGRAAALGLSGLMLSIGFGQLIHWGDAQAWHGTNIPPPDLGWTWKDAKLIGGAVTDDHTTWGYGPLIIDLVNNWYNTTVVKPTNGTVALHGSNRVHYHSVRLGVQGSLGYADTLSIEGYSSLQRCNEQGGGAITGLCNKTDHRATYADIDINDDLLAPGKAYGYEGFRRHTFGHELGHIFALSHPTDYCLVPPPNPELEAIMRQTVCSDPLFLDVRGHDAYDTAILYP